MHLALNRTVPLLRIARAPDAIAATAIMAAAVVVTGDHAAPREAVPAADIAGFTPEGGPIPMTHHDPGPLNDSAIGHGPTKGIDPATKVGLDPQGDAPVIDPVLQIASIPGVF